MYNELKNKAAIVTGGSSGIGKGIAERFAKEGVNVVITGRHEDSLKAAAAADQHIHYVVADMTNTDDVAKTVAYVKDNFGRLDILVNCAGWCPVQDIKHMTLEDYNKAFDLDVKAVVDMTIQSLPMLLESKGNIINLSSIGATRPGINLSMYTGAKAAVENFTKVWAVELAQDGVRVNAIAPGAVETNIWDVPGLTKEQSEAHMKNIIDGIPVKRMGKPEDIANMAAFLISDQADYITGSIFKVDGALAI